MNKIEFQLSRGLRKRVSDRLLREAACDALERATVTADTLDLGINDVKKIDVRETLQIREERNEDSERGRAGTKTLLKAKPAIYAGTSNIETRVLVDFIIKKNS